MLGNMLATKLTLFGVVFAASASAAPANVSCAGCDKVAHGFASLNGGTSGGKGGRIVTATTFTQLEEFAGSDEPLVIRVDGTLEADPWGYEIPVTSDKTIIGVGQTGHIHGGGFNIQKQKNIIIRNLEISGNYMPEDYNGKQEDWDGIQIDTGSNIWIDYCKVMRMFILAFGEMVYILTG